MASSDGKGGDPVVEYLVTCERVKFTRMAVSTEEFHVVIEEGVVRGFALYIVEQWLTDRQHFFNSVVVYTGNQEDVLQVCVLKFPNRSPHQIFPQFKDAGMRPMTTPLGFLMVTSLNRVSSLLNLIHMEGSDYEVALQQMVISVNLRRHGCSGRAAVTLKPPSVAKERFMSMYKIHAGVQFDYAIVELTRLVQCALHLFGFFPLRRCDGLLCDETVDALKRYAASCSPIVSEMPASDDVAISPKIVAHLISSVMVVRTALGALTYVVPKDPFSEPMKLSRAISFYQNAKEMDVTGVITHKQLPALVADSAQHKQSGSSLIKSRLQPGRSEEQALRDLKPTTDLLVVGKNSSVERVRYLWTGQGRQHDDRDDPMVGDGEGASAATPREGGPRLGRSIKNAVADLVSKPLEGAKESGTLGFLKGVSEGFAGSIANTVDGFRGLGKDKSGRTVSGARNNASTPGASSSTPLGLSSAAASPSASLASPVVPKSSKVPKRKLKGMQVDIKAAQAVRSPGLNALLSTVNPTPAEGLARGGRAPNLAQANKFTGVSLYQVSHLPNQLMAQTRQPSPQSVTRPVVSPERRALEPVSPPSAEWTVDEEEAENAEAFMLAEERYKSRVAELQTAVHECDKQYAVTQTVLTMRRADFEAVEKRLQSVFAKSAEVVKEVERMENITSMLQYQLQVSEEKLGETEELVDTYVQTIDEVNARLAEQHAQWSFRVFAWVVYILAAFNRLLPSRFQGILFTNTYY